MPIGGSIESVTLDGRYYSVTADSDATISLGQPTNEVQSNGDDTARTVKTKVPWSIKGLVLSVDFTSDDAEFIQALAASNTDFAVSLTMADFSVWNGTGQIQGEFTLSTQSSTVSIELAGPGILTK